MTTVYRLNAEKVVKEPINPVKIDFTIAGEIENLAKVVVSQANKKVPLKFISNVINGNTLLVYREIPIKYLDIAPSAPAIPTRK